MQRHWTYKSIEEGLRLSVIVLMATCVNAGCEDEPVAKPNIQRPTTRSATADDAADTAVDTEEDTPELAYAYSPIGKRDPFRSFFEEFQTDSNSADLTELQKFEVDQLKLVAVVTGRATPYAMVEDPNHKGHTLTRGTLIGKNWGRVSKINADCVVIKEEYRDYTGRKVTNTISMCLPQAEELKLD